MSYGRPSKTLPHGDVRACSGKNTRLPDFCLPQRLRPGTSWMMNSNEVQSLSVSLLDGTRMPLRRSFETNPFHTPALPLMISCEKKSAITHVSFSQARWLSSNSLTLTLVWVSGTLPTALWQCGNLQTCLSARPELLMMARWSNVWLSSGVRPTSSSPSIDSTHQASKLHWSSTGTTPEYVSLTIFPGSRCPFLKVGVGTWY